MRIPDGGQEEGEVLNLDIIAALGQIAAVLTVIGGIFSYAVIRPLNESIRALKDTVDEMREEIEEGREQRQGLEVQLAKIDSSVRSAHHRIDDLEGRMP